MALFSIITVALFVLDKRTRKEAELTQRRGKGRIQLEAQMLTDEEFDQAVSEGIHDAIAEVERWLRLGAPSRPRRRDFRRARRTSADVLDLVGVALWNGLLRALEEENQPLERAARRLLRHRPSR